MPKYIGGDITAVTCNHPTLGTFNFATKSNESYNFDPGGKRSNDDANGVAGNGTMLDQVNVVRWFFEGPLMVDLESENEVKNLPALAESPELATWTIEHISGIVYKGLGKPVGDIQVDLNTAQLGAKISGGGKAEKL